MNQYEPNGVTKSVYATSRMRMCFLSEIQSGADRFLMPAEILWFGNSRRS
ncbi:hypothetical protein X777_02097 [Ooceraea biroi]|uniref:Uncharacterized protein n=1 Tax=Ooceraea biroi TaxID=2015173 RepID=A0A026WNB2_OOCBI|nr:hypothetical protein X777_02097 [Ooceraea biroi]